MGVYKRGDRWYVRWREHGQLVRKSLGEDINTKAKAEAAGKRIRQERRDAKLGIIDPSRCTLAVFADEYLVHRGSLNFATETVRRDGQALRSLAEVLGGDTLLRNLRPKKVEQWAAVLLSQGLKPTTINSYLRHIRAALNTAVEWNRLAAAPRFKPLREPDRLPRALLPAEAARLLFREKNFERRALWRWFLWTGARRQEAVNLTWQDVHLGPKPWMTLCGKGNKERIVPLMPEAVRALVAMGPSDLGPVWRFHFRGYRVARPVTGSPMSRWLKDATRRAGIDDAHLHDLRHTAATWMAARGVSERIIQEIMGHVSITTTQIYTRGMARMADLYDQMSTGLYPKSIPGVRKA